MKIINTLIILFVLSVMVVSPVFTLDRKSFVEIDIDQLTNDTQVTAPCSDNHMNIIWWIPVEFWIATFAQDPTASESDKESIINMLEPYSLLAVCQADISDFGVFSFYSENSVKRKIKITYISENQRSYSLIIVDNVEPDVQMLLSIMKPMMSAAMGDMGENFHFFVLDNYDRIGNRIIDPYSFGELGFRFWENSGGWIESRIHFPLNPLYVPRICPNGRPAHVTWKYCPWSGKKLPD